MEYIMYVFKESGKYYSECRVVVDVMYHHELLDKLESGEITTQFKDMLRVFVPVTSDHNEIPFAIPVR